MAHGRSPPSRNPEQLTRRDIVAFVVGARTMLFGDTGPDAVLVWNPTMYVEPEMFLNWAREEMKRLGLVPEAGPRNEL